MKPADRHILSADAAAAVARRRRRELDRILAILSRRYVLTDDPRLAVPAYEVGRYVASLLGKPPKSWPVHADVLLAARALEWTVVTRGCRRLFRGVRERAVSLEEALQQAQDARDQCYPIRQRIRVLAARARRESALGGAALAARTRKQLRAARRAAREKYRDKVRAP